MRITCLIFCAIIFMSTHAFAQSSERERFETIVERFLEQRKAMMEEMMKAFDDESFFSDSFFGDDVFRGFRGGGENVHIEEQIQDDGAILVIIHPKNKDMKLDIQSSKDQITVQGEMKVEEETTSQGSRSQSYSLSRFSQSVAIPEGYLAQTPEQKEDKIVIKLIPQQGAATDRKTYQKRPERMPIKKREGEEVI